MRRFTCMQRWARMREQTCSRAAQRKMPGASQWRIAWRPAGMHMTGGGPGLQLAQADTLAVQSREQHSARRPWRKLSRFKQIALNDMCGNRVSVLMACSGGLQLQADTVLSNPKTRQCKATLGELVTVMRSHATTCV